MGQMTLGECKNAILKLINQYSIAGGTVALSYNNQADYVARIIPLINDAQMEIAKTVRKIPHQLTIVQEPIRNLCGDTGVIHAGDKVKYVGETNEPAMSYYFEVSCPVQAAVHIEEKVNGVWKLVKNHKATRFDFVDGRGYCSFRGNAGSGAGPLRFKLVDSGSPFTFRNGAFYEFQFPEDGDVPKYKEFYEYEMPEYFYQLNGRGIPYYQGDGSFVMSHQFRWRGDRTLLLDRNLRGEFIVDFFRYPKRIAENADDEELLDNTPDTHEAIPYFVASMLCVHDNPSLSATLYNIFETRISRMHESTFSENLEVQDVYGINDGMGWC